MSANFRNPNFLLPNEVNMATNPALSEDRHSLYSMEFDGTAYVNAENPTELQFTGAFSVSFWMKSNATGNRAMVSKDNNASNPRAFSIERTNAYPGGYFVVYNGTTAYGVYVASSDANYVNLNDNNWHNVVAVYTPSVSVSLFVDGNFIKSNTTNIPASVNFVNDNLNIGRRSQGVNYFYGKIDEVAIFNSALTLSEVQALSKANAPANIMALNKKPIAYYPLGEQARDNTEWQFPNEVLQSQVFDFDGSTDFIDVGVSPNSLVGSSNAYTVSSWVNPDISGNLNIIGSMDSGNRWYFRVLNGYASYAYGSATGDNGYNTEALTGVSSNAWSHIMFTFDGSATHKIYINGDLKLTQSSGSGQTITSTKDVYIGALNNNGTTQNYFNGKLSNVAIWNSDQSANIANIYNNGSPQSSYTTTPTAWYKLNATNTYAGLNPNYHSALSFVSSQADEVKTGVVSISDDYSISGWFKWDNSVTYNYLWDFRDQSADNPALYLYNNTLILYINQAIAFTSSAITQNGSNWYNLTLTKSGTTYTAYANGVSLTSATVSNTFVNSELTIGNRSTSVGTTGLDGSISNLAIFNQAISAEDVKYLYNGGTPQTNISFEPTSWYKLDNLTTGIQDSGSASNNGTNSGATAVSSSVAVNQWNFNNVSQSQTPNYSSALSFAQNKIVTTPNVFSDIITGSNKMGVCTISYWYKSSGTGQRDYMSLNDATSLAAHFRVDSSNRFYYRESNNYLRFAAQTNLDEWNHHCWVFNSATSYDGTVGQTNGDLQFYVNGVAQAVQYNNVATPANDPWDRFNIARSEQASGAGLDFEMSNLQLYNTNFSASQVETLYNSGQPESTASLSPVSWYKLNNTSSAASTDGLYDNGSGSNNATNNGATEIQTNVWTPRLNGESDTLPTTALVSSDLQFESPYSNFSLNFDGTKYITIGSSTELDNVPSNPHSFSFWFKSSTAGDVISEKRSVNNFLNAQYTIHLTNPDGYVVWYGGASTLTGTQTSTTLIDNQWHHIVCVAESTTVNKIYVDGQLDVTSSANRINSAVVAGTFNIGANYVGSYRFNGNLDEAAIFSKALTQAEVSQVYNNGYAADLTSLSPVSWWRLGEDAYFVSNLITIPNQISGAPNGTGSGTMTSTLVADAPGSYASGVGTDLADTDRKGEAPESSANSQSINMIPGDVHPYIPGYVPTQVNNVASMSFDGQSYVSAPISTLNSATVCSISFWGKKDSSSVNLNVGGYINNSQGIWIAWYLDGNIYFSPRGTGGAGFGLTYAQTYDTNWHHYVGVYDGTSAANCKLYLDGNLVATGTGTPPSFLPATTGDVFQIGALGTTFYTTGNIDEVAIFNYALTPKQIKQDIYDASTTGKTADLNNNSNLTAPVAWYRMGD